MKDKKTLIIEAYKMVLQNEDQPDLEAIWGCSLGLSDSKNSISKQEVEELLKDKHLKYSFNGEIINNPNQEVW